MKSGVILSEKRVFGIVLKEEEMYRVLLVDDEILVREAISANIDWNGLGYQLVGDCQNGKEAMEFVQKCPVDLVLTDICMPYMDGMELSCYLHDNYPETKIIIFSGFGEFEYAKKAIQYNVSEYLLKPVTAVELTEILKKMKKTLESAKKEEQKLENLTKNSEEYRKNKQMIRSQAISSLVTRSQEPDACVKKLEELGVFLEASDYRVAVVSIDIYSGLYEQSMTQRQESALMTFVVYNISDEVVRNYEAGIAYQEANNRVGILFQTNKPMEFSRMAEVICKEIKEKVYETMTLDISIAVGSYVKKLEDLHLSYDEADKALEYRYLLGGKLFLNMEKDKKFGGEAVLEDQLEKLTSGLQKNRREEIQESLDTIQERIIESRVNKSRACLYLQQVLRTISSVVEKIHSNPRSVEERKEELLNSITSQRTFQDAMEQVEEFAWEAADYMERENSSSGKRQALQALEYIQEHYAQQDLSLNTVCSYLGISTSHFSTIFKEMTGETFMEVLIRTRMDKAKELLEHTTLKNYEIAERVGFSDPHYFSISFKKMTGMTPTVYARKNHR